MISLILSGGIGSRLWPISKKSHPKQFTNIFGENLFTRTVKRLETLGEIHVCTSRDLQLLTEQNIKQKHLPVTHLLYEPSRRNTAPAVALACLALLRSNRNHEIMGVFPCDHWIENQVVFQQAIALAKVCAEKNQVVTIGAKPRYPATGFGYIGHDHDIFLRQDDLTAFGVKIFREKPDPQQAQEYLVSDSPVFFWNTGIFIFKVQTMIECFKKYTPLLWETINESNMDLSNLSSIYEKLPNLSLDHGILEKIQNHVNIPCDMDWSDLGSWDDIAQILESNASFLQEEAIIDDSRNCFIYNEEPKTICLSHVKDLLVINTNDALLIVSKGNSQSVKNIHKKE